MSLEKLLAPCSPDEFMSAFFEREFLHIERNDSTYFGELLSDLNLKQQMWRCSDAWGRISLARAATAGNPHAGGKPGIDTLEAAYADGYTIVLNNVQDQSLASAAFCRDIEKYFLFRCNANIYLTGPHCQGLDAHYDDQDVFILQLEGSKNWRVFRGGPVLPLEEQSYDCPDIAALSFVECRLRPGDVLYLPRGFIHDARTEHQASLHLTISVSVVRQIALLKNALQHLAEREPALRRAISPARMQSAAAANGDGENDDGFALLNNVLARLDGSDYRQAISSLHDRLLSALSRLPSGVPFAKKETAPLSADSVVAIASDQICLLSADNGVCTLKFIGGQLALSEDLYAAARFICDRRQFQVAQIAGDLSTAQKIHFVEFLMSLGVLEQAAARASL